MNQNISFNGTFIKRVEGNKWLQLSPSGSESSFSLFALETLCFEIVS